MQAAYVRLLQNPFYDPDEHSPPTGRGGKKITSRRFTEDMKRIGESVSNKAPCSIFRARYLTGWTDETCSLLAASFSSFDKT